MRKTWRIIRLYLGKIVPGAAHCLLAPLPSRRIAILRDVLNPTCLTLQIPRNPRPRTRRRSWAFEGGEPALVKTRASALLNPFTRVPVYPRGDGRSLRASSNLIIYRYTLSVHIRHLGPEDDDCNHIFVVRLPIRPGWSGSTGKHLRSLMSLPS